MSGPIPWAPCQPGWYFNRPNQDLGINAMDGPDYSIDTKFIRIGGIFHKIYPIFFQDCGINDPFNEEEIYFLLGSQVEIGVWNIEEKVMWSSSVNTAMVV